MVYDLTPLAVPTGISVPTLLNYPFAYVPHPLAQLAAQELRQRVLNSTQWSADLASGKMFGVLIVRDDNGNIGYLSAFSGTLGGRLSQTGFVPPLLDFDTEGGIFNSEQQAITELNHLIDARQQSQERRQLSVELTSLTRQSDEAIAQAVAENQRRRAERTVRRSAEPALAASFDRESQYQKAELRRLKERWLQRCAQARQQLDNYDAATDNLRQQRQHRSQVLQRWLFRTMKVRCHDGSEVSVWDVFASAHRGAPPAATGDCAGCRLLNHAFRNGLKPLALAEFWLGPDNDTRRNEHFYPCCQSKCGPLLRRMLRDYPTQPNPLTAPQSNALEVVYEDSWLLVVNKPPGLLTVGTTEQDSVMRRLQRSGRDIEPPGYVHRLDQATSGLLLVAKDAATHHALQDQFEQRQVRKRYISLVEGVPTPPAGFVRLPLRPDYNDRPRQMVDLLIGKPAVTRYETLCSDNHISRLAFYPLTGRTHQLRLHAAAKQGLNCPIVGDNLYGRLGQRLMLHADRLTFTHPATGETVTFQAEAEF